MTREELEKIRFAAELNGELDEYVYLREDSEGRAPHDNRCLSWYDSYQEEAYIRNKWVEGLSDEDKKKRLDSIKKDRDSKVGRLFRLSSFTCGYEEYPTERIEESRKSWEEYHPGEPFIPSDHICRVGNPANKCQDTHCKYWTYKEPVKCACWYLMEVSVPTHVVVPIDLAMKSIRSDSN